MTKKKKNCDENNYWNLREENMIALFLCVLLILLFLILYLVQVPEEDFGDKNMGDSHEMNTNFHLDSGNHSYGKADNHSEDRQNGESGLNLSCNWDNPYMVKNVIRMELKDRDDGDSVTGATFQVVAASDIITQDGKIRYEKGKVADIIYIDENGYGESKKLYLGKYLLKQEKVSKYYGKITTEKEVSLESGQKVKKAEIVQLTEDKTSIIVILKDALYDTTDIEGGKFTLSQDDGTVEEQFVTDDKGRIKISDLKKNTTYHIRQTETADRYRIDIGDYSFTVDRDGLIDGETQKQIVIKNRLIRVNIGIKDKLFKGMLSGVNVTIYDIYGNVVETWNAAGIEKNIKGLDPGKYKVVLAGDEKNAQIITVGDETELQKFEFERWTIVDIATIMAVILLVIGVFVVLKWIFRDCREKKCEGKEQYKY